MQIPRVSTFARIRTLVAPLAIVSLLTPSHGATGGSTDETGVARPCATGDPHDRKACDAHNREAGDANHREASGANYGEAGARCARDSASS